MENSTGLLIGIDIQENSSQLCFFDVQTKEPQNILFSDKKTMLDNPVPLSKWGDISKNGSYGEMDQLVNYIATLIEYAKKLANVREVSRICITVCDFQVDILDAISVIMNKLMLPREQWMIIGHEESYAYYAYNQKRELYASGVMLVDYGVNGITAHLMSNGKYNNNEVIMENKYVLESDDIKAVPKGEKTLEDVEDEIINWLAPTLQDYIVSSLYLTGAGFNVNKFPDELTRFFCNRRKVFAGQNIFVKGACFAAYEDSCKGKMENVILACNNRVTTGIELNIVERGVPKRLRVIKPGTNWYQARRKLDFILEDVSKITLIMKPCDTSKEYYEEIDISEIPYRKGKMTRIGMDFQFNSDSRCTITVKDKGFGEFVKSSGKVVYKEISI